MNTEFQPGTLCVTKRPSLAPGKIVMLERRASWEEVGAAMAGSGYIPKPTSAGKTVWKLDRPVAWIVAFDGAVLLEIPFEVPDCLRPIAGPGLSIDTTESTDEPVAA